MARSQPSNLNGLNVKLQSSEFLLRSFCDLFQVATVRPSSFSAGNADNIVVSKYTHYLVFIVCICWMRDVMHS